MFDIVERPDGRREAKVARPELCSMARNGYTEEWAVRLFIALTLSLLGVLTANWWQERLKIFKIKNHFIFSIESAGQCRAEQVSGLS